MKRIKGVILMLCLLLFFTACARELPDPTPVVKDFYENSIKSIDGKMAKLLLDQPDTKALAEGLPELEEPLKAMVDAYLKDIKYQIIEEETSIDSKEGTAQVLVKVDCISLAKLDDAVKRLVIEKSNEIMATGRAATKEELSAYHIEMATQLIAEGKIERISGYQDVGLVYDQETGIWEITNTDAMINDLI